MLLGENNFWDNMDENQKWMDIKTVTIHQDYIHNDKRNSGPDLAILTLFDPISFSAYVRPVCLPYDATKDYAGVHAKIIGWGGWEGELQDYYDDAPPSPDYTGDFSSNLRRADVKVLSNEACIKSSWGPFIKEYDFIECTCITLLSRFHVCSSNEYHVSHCRGDSGGPMFVMENTRSVHLPAKLFNF